MSLIDISIIIIYIVGIFSIGFLLRNRVTSFNDFMIANSKMGVGLGIASMAGTELGLITVMYNAQKGVTGYFAAFHIGLIAFLVTLVVGLSGFVIVRLRKLKVKSIPEFYEKRYGKNVRVLGAIFLVLGGILNMGLFLQVGGRFLEAVFGLNELTLPIIMLALLTLVLFYTMMGGMLSVIITDYIQFVVLSVGLIASTFLVIYKIGWNKVVNYLTVEKGESAFNPIINADFGYDYILWMIMLGFVSCVIWPTATTRALAMKDHHAVKKQYLWSSISFLIRFIIPCFLGIAAYAYIDGGHLSGVDLSSKTDQLKAMPLLLKNILPVGLLGLIIAGMLAAFMSTHDSYLLCWSTIITNDIISPLSKNKLNSDRKIFLSRLIMILIGIYILYWGLFYKGSDDIFDYLAITGSIYFSGAISLVVFGLYSKKVNIYGAYCSLFCGLLSLFGFGPIREYFEIPLSGALIGLITLVISFFMMFFGSFYGRVLFLKKERVV